MKDDSIKLMSLLEELEDLITSSSKMPFSEKGIIDLDVAQKIMEDIRLNLPRDIQQAKWLNSEKDRIISEAKREYNRMINEAKDQVEYLVNNNNITKDAQKRADALVKGAEKLSNFTKYRSYEYIDELLFDLQNDIDSVRGSYIEPMTQYFNQMISNINTKLNQNRQEMLTLAERVKIEDDDYSDSVMPESMETESVEEEL